MKRLTTKFNGGYLFNLPPKNNENDLSAHKEYVDKVSVKLGEYEDLEEKLEKVYGKCEGLLETAVNSLVKHEGAEIGTPAKARLLTDEDVEKWESFKDAEEQGLLLRLPCKVGDKVYHIEDGYIYEFNAEKIEIRKEDGEYIYCIDSMDYRKDDFEKIVFFTVEEAEQALAKMKEV